MKSSLAVCLCVCALAGLLVPKSSHPILLSYNNQQTTSSYTFKIQIETSVPATGLLVIYFPNNFASGLGVTTCSTQDEQGNSYSCTISGTTVTITPGYLSNSPVDNTYIFQVNGVLNPTSTGMTGHFRMETYSGANLLDYCDMFGQIGIDSSAAALTTTMFACLSGCLTGQVGLYQIGFTTPTALPPYARVFLTFPSTISLLNPPPCISTTQSYITCSKDSTTNLVTLGGLYYTIPANTVVVITFSNVQNPIYSGSIGTLKIEIFQPLVNSLIGVASGIVGPAISPNAITGILVCPNSASPCTASQPNVAINNRMVFTVSAATTNSVPANGLILVTFPTSFGTMETGTCQITSGLNNLGATASTQVTCTVNDTTKKLTITNFALFPAGSFSLQVRVTTPLVSGVASYFNVFTYQDVGMTQLIDMNQNTATTTISTIVTTNVWNLNWYSGANLVTTFASAAQLTLTLVFRPNVSITNPANSLIQMKFPTGFTLSASTSVILMPNQYAAQTTLAGVSFGSNTFQCPFSSVGYTIPNNEDTQIVVNNGGGYFQMPTTPGMYPVEMILQNFLAGSITTTAFMYWMSVTAPQMTTISASSLTVDINKMTVYTINLTPTLTVPSSVIPVSTATAWGAIDVQFPTQDTNLNALWAIDLGTGFSSGATLPCLSLSNMSVVSGSVITCTLYPAASVGAGLYSTVRVTNFQSLPAGTSVSFTIANIANGQTGGVQPSLTVVTYSIIQSFMQPLNSNSNVQIPIAFYDDGTTALPVINGRSPSPNGDGSNVVQFTPNTLNVATTLTFILWLENALTAGIATTGLIIKMPMTYPIPYTGVACYMSYTITATCYTYPACGWIVFTPLPVAVGNLATHTNYQVTITGLTNPINRINPTSLSIIPAQGNHESEYIYFTNFTPLSLGAVSGVSITTDNYQANSVDTTYTFGFTLTDNLAVGSTVVITFPQNSYVLTTVPAPSCSISGGLNALSKTQPILCAFTANAVTISQFTNYVGGNAVSVRIQHILNPLNAGLTDVFNIESFSQAGLLEDGNYSIPGVVILNQSTIPVLTHNNFWAVPSNGYATGVLLTVSITPSISIPAQSIIKIVYPLEFSPIPAAPICTMSGALKTLLSCSSDGNTVLQVTTDTKYDISSTQAPLNITIAGIKNFAPGITSGIVTVSIFCSNQLITESSTDPYNRKFTTDLKTNILTVKSYDFDPQTSGEEAMYNFTIALTTSFLKNCSMNVQFPSSVPRGLNQFIGCMSTALSPNTDGSMDCYASGRTVVINGTAGWTTGTSQPIVNLTIRRITNPSVGGRLDTFTVYTQCGNMIYDIGTLQSTFVFTTSPAAMYYQNSTISSNACGYSSSLSLQVKTSTTTASLSDDRWLVTFPPAYTMKYIADQLLCTSNQTAVSPAQSTYYMNQISISAFNSTQSVSAFQFSVQGIENPYVVGDIPYLVTSWHEPSTRKVLAKTASNLNRVLPFTFQKIGKDILVNYNLPWVVSVGTWSDQMYVTLQANSPADFILTPASIPGITVIPNPINFALGDSFQGFHMSADESVVPGSYNMSWTVTGAWTQSIYAPVQRSFFTVQSPQNENITMQSPGVIPQGGSSVPLAVSLTRPPASGLKLSLVQLGSIPTKMNFSSPVISFAPGETVKSFHILISNESYGTEGEYLVFKSGPDAVAYQLAQSSYTFQVGKPTANKPVVLDAKVVSVSRNSALIRMLTNAIVKVFYMTGYYGTRAPTQQEFSEGSFKNSTQIKWMPWFNSTTNYVDQTTQYQYSITLDGLTAQTRYTFYAEIQDDLNNIGASLVTFNFTTSNRFNPAYCTMRFLQFPLGDGFRHTIINNVASILGIKSTLIQVVASLTDNSTATNSTSVSSDAPLSTITTGGARLLVAISYATVYIFSDPTVPSDTEPVQLVVSLNNLRLQLKALMPTFDDSIQLSAKELTASAPVFFLQAKFASTTNGVLVLNNLSLMQNGYIYLCFVEADLIPVTPTSYQIFNGVDAGNAPCWLSDSVSASATPIDYTKTGFPNNANFWVFFTASNWLTVSPALLPDTQVASLGFTTRGTYYSTIVATGRWTALALGFVFGVLI